MWHVSGAISLSVACRVWDVSSVSDMFHGAISLSGTCRMWDVSSVSDMYGMFHGAISPSVTCRVWDVSIFAVFGQGRGIGLGLGLMLVGRGMRGRVCMGTYMHVCVRLDTCVHVVSPGR